MLSAHTSRVFRKMEAERDTERHKFGILAKGVPALERFREARDAFLKKHDK